MLPNLSVLLATALVLNLIVTAIFLLKTKSQSSKMLVTLLFSTTGVGFLLVLFDCDCINSHLFLDIALVFVLLSSVAAIVFAKRLRYVDRSDD